MPIKIRYESHKMQGPVVQRWVSANPGLLSFQLKCSSNIDSIHYLRLTNSFHQVPRDIHTLPVKEPIPRI